MITIPIAKSKLVAFISDEDEALVCHRRWVFNDYSRRYVYNRIAGRRIALHRLIANPGPTEVVDHINGDALDNRRENLRVCSNAENALNRWVKKTSDIGFKGVTFGRGAFIAKISAQKTCHYLGRFGTADEAARAYDEAARRLHGPFAALNFPSGPHERCATSAAYAEAFSGRSLIREQSEIPNNGRAPCHP